MPLTMLNNGESAAIKKVGGKEEVKKFLNKLGFVTGEEVKIVSSSGGNVIVMVKDTRVAISKSVANKIMV